MTNSMIPYSFTPGTKAKAQEVNANFNALADKIDENDSTALHYNTSATISGDMTFTKPIVSTGNYVVTQGNITIKNLANNASTDAIIVINGDTNQRCGSLRLQNGDKYNEITLTAAAENGGILSMGMRNTDGAAYAFCPTYTTNYADSSTKIVTTAFLTNRWTTSKATTTSSASKARPAVVIQNYVSGANWYRIWSDGWIEQGGTTNSNTTSDDFQITLLKPMSNTNYYANYIVTSNNVVNDPSYMHSIVKNTTRINIRDYCLNSANICWVVTGY